jgi:hypothetical protein
VRDRVHEPPVQQARNGPLDLKEQYLPLLEEAAAQGDASPRDLAHLRDQVMMSMRVADLWHPVHCHGRHPGVVPERHNLAGGPVCWPL